jgi:hypothetical protein
MFVFQVELKAFCSKHSSVGYVNSLEKSNNASEQGAREVRTKDANLSIGKIPKLRFTRKNKDRSMNYETGSFNPDSLIKVETMEHGALPRTVRSSDTQATRNMEMDTDNPSVSNLMRNSGDIAMVLKKVTADSEPSCYSGIYCLTFAKKKIFIPTVFAAN